MSHVFVWICGTAVGHVVDEAELDEEALDIEDAFDMKDEAVSDGR